MSEFKGQLAQNALGGIPTECRRCRRLFDDKEMCWVDVNPGERWWVCYECSKAIVWANNQIKAATAAWDSVKKGKI